MIEVETQRLRMRKYELEDADEQLRILSDPEFRRHLRPLPLPTRDMVVVGFGRIDEHWRLLGYGHWALELKTEGRIIGHCGLKRLVETDEVELYYGADPAYWGRGLVTEAARAALRYGFGRAGLARVMAVTDKDNKGSRRVMEKSGLRYERDDFYFGVPVVYYALNREDWRDDDAPYEEKE